MLGLSFRNFAAPWWFLLLVVVALIVVGYVVVQRMRHKRTMRFTNLELLERVVPKRLGWVRHLPAPEIERLVLDEYDGVGVRHRARQQPRDRQHQPLAGRPREHEPPITLSALYSAIFLSSA